MVELANRLYDFDIQRDPNKPLKIEDSIKKNKSVNNLKKLKLSKFRKSLNMDGKVIVREDHGLLPLQEIKKILQSSKQTDQIGIVNFPQSSHNLNTANNKKRQSLFGSNEIPVSKFSLNQYPIGKIKCLDVNNSDSVSNKNNKLESQENGLIPLQEMKKILSKQNDQLGIVKFPQCNHILNSANNKKRYSLFGSNEIPVSKFSPNYYPIDKLLCTEAFNLDTNGNKNNTTNKLESCFQAGKNEQDNINTDIIKLSDNINDSKVQQKTQAQQQLDTQMKTSDENMNTFRQAYQNQFNAINTQQTEGDQVLQQSSISLQNSPSSKRQTIYQQNKQKLFQMGLTDTKSFLEKEISFILQRSREIRLKFLFLLNKLTCHKLFNTKEVQLLRKAEKMVLKDMDVFTIVDKLKQLDKLKKLFLSKEQETLFNFFPKPFISLSNQENEFNKEMLKEELKIDKNDKKLKKKNKKPNKLATLMKAFYKFKNIRMYNSLSKYQELFECYQNLLNQNRTKSEAYLNEKLIKQLGEEMNNIFEVADLMNNLLFKGKNSVNSMKYSVQPEKSMFSVEKKTNDQEIVLTESIEKMQKELQNTNVEQKNNDIEQVQININQETEQDGNNQILIP